MVYNTSHMRYFRVVLTIFVLALGGLALVIALARNKLQPAQIAPNIIIASPSAMLIVIMSPVQVKRGDSWEEGIDKQILYAGQSVRTLGLGKADVLFEGIGTIRLDQKTEITVSTLTEKAVLITQGIGNTYSKVKKFFDSEQKYEVETPTAVASVRGTAFGVLVDSTYKTSVIVTSNTVAVAPVVIVDGEKKRLPAATVPEDQATHIDKEVIRRAQQEGVLPPVVSKEALVSPDLRQWLGENKTKDEEFDREEREEKIESATPSGIRHRLLNLIEPLTSESSPGDKSDDEDKNETTPTPKDSSFDKKFDNKPDNKNKKETISTPEPTKFIESPEPSDTKATPPITPNPSATPSDIQDQMQRWVIKPIQKLIKSIEPSPDNKSDDDKNKRETKPAPESIKPVETPWASDIKRRLLENDKDKPDRADTF